MSKKGWLAAASVTAGALAAAAAAENKRRRRDDEKYPCPGTMVRVDGKKMHIRICGEGDRTIVFLPGLGTACPSLDFYPLASRLTSFRCAIPEPFGYGWSDPTRKPRTVENIVAELREGLAAAGVLPPYLLLGHSVAGLYLRWWACRYPDEISGIIGDDPSVPEQAKEKEMMEMLPDHGLAGLKLNACAALSPLGAARISALLSPEPAYLSGGDISQLGAAKYCYIRTWNGPVVRSEYRNFARNARLADEALPACPVLVFVATGAQSCTQLKFASGFSWVEAHERIAAQAGRGRCVELPGSHYLHWQFADRMAREITDFFR